MKKVRLLICAAFALMAFAACGPDENPVIPDEPTEPVVNVDDPQEEMTDQPAYTMQK